MEKSFYNTDIIKFLIEDDIILYLSEQIFEQTNKKIDLELYLFMVKYYVNNYLDIDIMLGRCASRLL